MKFIGTNSNLRSEAEFTAIGKSSGGIPINCGGIDLIEKLFSCLRISRDDPVAVMRTVRFNVMNGCCCRIDDFNGKNQVKKFGPIIFRSRRLKRRVIELSEKGMRSGIAAKAAELRWQKIFLQESRESGWFQSNYKHRVADIWH